VVFLWARGVRVEGWKGVEGVKGSGDTSSWNQHRVVAMFARALRPDAPS